MNDSQPSLLSQFCKQTVNYLNRYKVIAFLTFFCLFLGSFQLAERSLWLDECFSVTIVESWRTLLMIITKYESNMWLYYFVLFVWSKFGQGEFYLRLLSVLFGVCSIPLIYSLTKKLFQDKFVAKMSAFFLCANVYFIEYIREARAYSLLMLLALLSCHVFLSVVRNKFSKWEWYTISAILTCYAHLFGILVIGAQFISLFFREDQRLLWKKWLGLYAVVFICITPIFIAVLFGGQQANWIPKVDLDAIVEFFVALSGKSAPLMLLYGYTIVISLQALIRSENNYKWELIFVFLVTLFPVLLAYIVSLRRPVFVPRFLIASLPFFLILGSYGFSLIGKKWLQIILIGMIAYLSIDNLYAMFYQKHEDWRETVEYVLNRAKPKDGIVFFSYYIRRPFIYYYNTHPGVNKMPVDILELSSGPYAPGGSGLLPPPNMKLMNSLPQKYPRIWLVVAHDYLTKLNYDKQSDEIYKLIENKYDMVENEYFTYGINVYMFKLKKQH